MPIPKSIERSLLAASVLAVLFSAAVHAQTQVAAPGQTVVTGADGRQILFRDRTTLTAGPESTVKVTRANYDDRTGTGNVVLNVTKGAFRYVTGNTNGTHSIVTPLSTVGVRGTVIEGYVLPGRYEIFVLIEGAFEVCSRAACQTLTTPGTFTLVNANRTVTPPQSVPASFLSAMMSTVPQLNLAVEYFSDVLKSGRDPLIRFQEANEATSGMASAPNEKARGGSTSGSSGGGTTTAGGSPRHFGWNNGNRFGWYNENNKGNPGGSSGKGP